MPGTSIAALQTTDMEPGWLFISEDTSGGFTAGQFLQRNSDNTAFETVGLQGHLHTDAASGGTLADVDIANIPLTLELNKRFARASAFWQTIVTSGTITDDATNGRINIQSGTTS